MKLLVFVLLCAFVLTGGEIEAEENELDFPTAAMSANMNAYMDLVMIQVGPWVLQSGVIPMPLPDLTEDIEYSPLLITYTGKLHLTKGILTRLVSVARSGNSVMSYERDMLRIAMAASVRQIAFTYDYDAEIMGLGPKGWLEGNTNNLDMSCDFIVDFSDFMIYMQDFKVVSLGDINITMKGNILIDWMGSLFVNTITKLFRGPITDFISNKFKELLQQTINEMNDRKYAANHSFEEIKQRLQNVLAMKGIEMPLM